MAQRDTFAILVEEIGKALLPLRQAISSPENFFGFMIDLGWTVDSIPPSIQALDTRLQALEGALESVLDGTASIEEVEQAGREIEGLVNAIQALESAAFDASLTVDDFANLFPKQLRDYLIVRYLHDFLPRLGFALSLLGLIRVEYQRRSTSGIRPPFMLREIAWAEFTQLLQDPAHIFETAFKWGTPQFKAEKLLNAIQDFVISLRAQAFVETVETDAAQLLENHVDIPGNPIRFRLNIPLFDQQRAEGAVAAGLGLFGLPQDGASLPGLALMPYVKGSVQQRFEIIPQFFFSVDGSLDLQGGVALKLRPGEDIQVIVGFNDPASATTAKGKLTVRLDNENTSGEPIVLVKLGDGSRLQMKALSAVGGLSLSANDKPDLFIELELREGLLLVLPGEGLLKEILPKEGVSVRFNPAVGFSSQRGFYFRGSAGLETTLAAHFTIGPVSVDSIYLAIKAEGSDIHAIAAATIKIKFGPVEATIQRLGFKADLSFPGSGGRLGPIDFDLGFKPPNGIGLVIDGGGFKGGGFLSHDPGPPERYFGALLLKAQKMSISAFGVFEESAAGDPSFALILGARFTPGFSLGFGFILTGVGGLIGINRSIDVDKMRLRLASGTAGNLLFTDDPVKNAPRLLGDLQELLPAADGVYVFGPTARITWTKVAKFDLGILIELPGPSKIVLLGTARIKIGGDEETGVKPAVDIRLDVLGVIDFPKKTIQFDASLIDPSTLMQVLKLNGDAAFQMNTGDRPYAMLAVGGFHPAFNPEPAVFRKLTRITATYEIGGHSNLHLQVEGYFAITSNTFQVGGKLIVQVSAGSINAEGTLGFDALIQFKPFHFTIDFSASIRVKYKSHKLGGVSFNGKLSGPGPLVLSGKFCFEILFFDICWSDSFTIGDGVAETIQAVASLVEALAPEITLGGNLQALDVDDGLVAFSNQATDSSAPLFPPVQRLAWSQNRAPFDFSLDRFEGAPLSSRQAVLVTADKGTATPIMDWFSPGTFLNLSQSEALNKSAFQRMESGISIDFGISIDSPPPPVPSLGGFASIILPVLPGDSKISSLTIDHPALLFDAASGRNSPILTYSAPPVVAVSDQLWEIRTQDGSLVASNIIEAEAHQRAGSLGAIALPVGDVANSQGVF